MVRASRESSEYLLWQACQRFATTTIFHTFIYSLNHCFSMWRLGPLLGGCDFISGGQENLVAIILEWLLF